MEPKRIISIIEEAFKETPEVVVAKKLRYLGVTSNEVGKLSTELRDDIRMKVWGALRDLEKKATL